MRWIRRLGSVALTGALIALSVWQASPAGAAAGDLDPGFGRGGHLVTDAGDADFASAVAVQPDGKVVVGGETSEGFLVARYDHEGALDGDFGDGGIVVSDFGSFDRARDVLVQSDGRIVVIGSVVLDGSPTTDFAIARYLSDGSPDGSFGTGGLVTADMLGGQDIAHAAAFAPDGDIVVAGSSLRFETDWAVARFTSTGEPDGSFSDDGLVGLDIGHVDVALGIAVQEDGRIVVAGNTFNQRGGNFALARFLPGGSLDQSFGRRGVVRTGFGGGDNSATDVAVLGDDRIVVAGNDDGIRDSNFGLARYLDDGSLDDTFGEDGRVSTSFGLGLDYALGLVVQDDGRVVAVGTAGGRRGPNFALARYLEDGALDPTFGSGGRVQTDFRSGEDSALDIALDANGMVVLAGRTFDVDTFDTNTALARYLND